MSTNGAIESVRSSFGAKLAVAQLAVVVLVIGFVAVAVRGMAALSDARSDLTVSAD